MDEQDAKRRLSWRDPVELAGFVGLVVFAGLLWLPAALLVGSLVAVGYANFGGRGN